ncbi:hypothetical protein MP638_002721, partial [Amoeboaphelidium occidentale]
QQRDDKFTVGQTIFGLIGTCSIIANGFNLYHWYFPSERGNLYGNQKERSFHRKIKGVEDCLINCEKRVDLKDTGIPKVERLDFVKHFLSMSTQQVINVEGPSGCGKSHFMAEMFYAEKEKGTPVAHICLRGIELHDIPSWRSVANYVCYQLGFNNAVMNQTIGINVTESTDYVERALRKMRDEGKPTPIIVIDDAQTLFNEDAVDFVSSREFLGILVQWCKNGLARPFLICTDASISEHIERDAGVAICTRTFRLPEISDTDLFNHLKLKANPLRLENNLSAWTDEEIRHMIYIYGDILQSINRVFHIPDSPTSIVDDDLQQKKNDLARVSRKNPGCESVIEMVLQNGCIDGGSYKGDRNLLEALVNAKILAMINGRYIFHSRIVKRAAEALFPGVRSHTKNYSD